MEAVGKHAFVHAVATSEMDFLPFEINHFIERLMNYGPGVVVIGFDKPIPDEIPPSSMDFVTFKMGEGFGDKVPRKCSTIYFKCMSGETAEFKGWGM